MFDAPYGMSRKTESLNNYKRQIIKIAGLSPGAGIAGPKPERQQDAAVGTPEAARDALTVDEGGMADSSPMQAPQQLHVFGRSMPHMIMRLKEEVHELWWSSMGPRRDAIDRSLIRVERQQDAAVGTPEAARDALTVDEGGMVDSSPMLAPQQLHVFGRSMPHMVMRLKEEVHELWWSSMGPRRDAIDRSLIRVGSLPGWSVS
uniref:Uncharacterized protein n=1 Tax=Tanacetum cinerariifolium TaxID=118510 RepID=A0A6L2J1I7_TANCI|nr:hypothetical protein [Tanacetum cinerariifolium]